MPMPYTSIQPYLVGKDQYSQYQTIQAGINAAHAAGAALATPLDVYVKPSLTAYAENLTLYDGVNVKGLGVSGLNQGSVVWTGTATWASTGTTATFSNIEIKNLVATDVFTMSLNSTLNFIDCGMDVSNNLVYTNDAGVLNITNCISGANSLFNCDTSGGLQVNIQGGNITCSATATGSVQFNVTQANLSAGNGYLSTSQGGAISQITLSNCLGSFAFDATATTNPGSTVQTFDCNFDNGFSCTGIGYTAAIIGGISGAQSTTTFIDTGSSGAVTVILLDVAMQNGNSIATLAHGSTLQCTGCDLSGVTAPTLSTGATAQYFNCTAFGGTGLVVTSPVLSTSATDGFIYLPSCAGVPTGVPTTFDASVPMVYNTSNSSVYTYNGSWKNVSGIVNSGIAGQVGYYATTSSSISGGTLQNILGVASNASSATGYVGELVSSVIASGSAININSNTSTNLTSISLTAGDWDIYGNIYFIPTVSFSSIVAWSSTTSATAPDPSLFNALSLTGVSFGQSGISIPFKRYSLSTTTTIYLSGIATFTLGTATFCGAIYARRRT